MESKSINICFIDTEFNALDYAVQNDGYQEITEIGAVVFCNGKVIDRFSRYCKLKEGHKLTRRCKKITGITAEILSQEGVPYLQAMKEFQNFLVKNKVKKVYAFGASDAFEMRSSAKLNNADNTVYETIKKIKNVYPTFESRLELHYVFSLFDICRICYVNHDSDRAHNAVNDAEDTGLAYYNMKQNKINSELLNEINVHKYNVKIYRAQRSVKMANIKRPDVVTAEFISSLEKVFENAGEVLGQPITRAVHDDMMRIIGRPDLELGEDDL